MKLKKIFTVFAAASFMLAANAQAALVEGQDYTVLPKPIEQAKKDKVEILEFFGYFCVHCYHLEPVMLKYEKQLPADVYVRNVHVVWQPSMLGLARIAAAVEQAGVKQQASMPIFQAVYEQKIDLANPDTFKAWAQQQKSFNSSKLLQAYNSFGNQAQAKNMQTLTETYQISSTPTVIVGGKYQVKFKGDWQQGIQTINELVDKVRQERGMAKPAAHSNHTAVKSKGGWLAKTANH